MRTLKESFKYCSDGFDKVVGDIKALRKEVKERTLCNQERQIGKNMASQRVKVLEQYTRGNSVDIKGVSVTWDVSEIVKNFGILVRESITESHIHICHRGQT